MKKIISAVLAGSMAMSLAACGGSSASNAAPAASGTASAAAPAASAGDTAAYEDLDPVELVLADSAAKGAAGQLFDEAFAAKVEEITGGQLTIDLHTNGDLGNDVDILRQMQSGDIDLVGCQIAPMVSFVPDLALFDLPMVFAKYDGDTIDKVLNGEDSEVRQTLNAAYEEADMHLLGFLQNATYRLTTSNTDLQTLADFKGLQIRTMENANHMAFWTAIGAEPTPLAWAEVYFALQSGTITAEENASDTVKGANLNEVQKYLANTNHILYCNQLSINNDKFNSLDPAYQQALQQAANEAMAEMRPQLKSIDETNQADLESAGMTIITYDDAFFDEILNLDGVKALYSSIDESIGGLGTTLQESLEAAA